MFQINGKQYRINLNQEVGNLVNKVSCQLIEVDGTENIVSEGTSYYVSEEFSGREIESAIENCLQYFS